MDNPWPVITEPLKPTVTDKDKENPDARSLEVSQKKRYDDNTKHREGLVGWVKCVVSLWLFATFVILSFNNALELSEGVLVALLTTTTVNILGLAFIVLRGLFRVDEE